MRGKFGTYDLEKIRQFESFIEITDSDYEELVWKEWLEFQTQIIKFAYMSLEHLNAITSSCLSFW